MNVRHPTDVGGVDILTRHSEGVNILTRLYTFFGLLSKEILEDCLQISLLILNKFKRIN